MQALILAAGLGTRLAPLTDRLPKALVEVGGRPLLAHVAQRLVAAGATRLVVNVCAHAGQIEEYLARTDLGAEVRVSREPDGPYDTGGGLAAARSLFRTDGPIWIHNVDVLSDVPLQALLEPLTRSGALAALAVMPRDSTRHLLFDAQGLVGRRDASRSGTPEAQRFGRAPVGPLAALAFAGIHAVAARVLARLTERGTFSILDAYLRLVGEGEVVLPVRVDAARWIDVGRLADLERARVQWPGPVAH